MELKAYECKSCGTVIWVPEDQDEPLYCPICRSSLTEVNIPFDEAAKRFECPECGSVFYMKGTPYKCAYCNYTFPTTPYRTQEERL